MSRERAWEHAATDKDHTRQMNTLGVNRELFGFVRVMRGSHLQGFNREWLVPGPTLGEGGGEGGLTQEGRGALTTPELVPAMAPPKPPHMTRTM